MVLTWDFSLFANLFPPLFQCNKDGMCPTPSYSYYILWSSNGNRGIKRQNYGQFYQTLSLVQSLHSISNSNGQILFNRADIRDLYHQPRAPVVVP